MEFQTRCEANLFICIPSILAILLNTVIAGRIISVFHQQSGPAQNTSAMYSPLIDGRSCSTRQQHYYHAKIPGCPQYNLCLLIQVVHPQGVIIHQLVFASIAFPQQLLAFTIIIFTPTRCTFDTICDVVLWTEECCQCMQQVCKDSHAIYNIL